MNLIVSILPKGEGFSEGSFGAIALCVRDFVQHSRYRQQTVVIGGQEGYFEDVQYCAAPRAKWYENRTHAYARACAVYIKQHDIRLAEVHNRPRFLHLLATKARCHFALHLHNDPQEMDAAHTVKERIKLLEMCDAVYCVSEYIRSRFLEGLNKDAAHKVHVVYNGINIPEIVSEKHNTILFVGRMTEGKGAMLLSEALRIALPKLPGWKAVMIGSRRHEKAAELTAHEKDIIERIKPLGSQVKMLGFMPHQETLEFFARSHIAVVPSLWQEPFGRTAIEAMSNGCALISSGTGGLYEVTEDAALTLRNMTPESLAEAITLLAENEQQRTRLQQAGRKRAEYFSIAGRTKVLDNIRESVLARQ